MWNRLRLVSWIFALLFVPGGTGIAYAAQSPATGQISSLPSTSTTRDGVFDKFVGTWTAHGAFLRISSDGGARFEERTYRWCGSGVAQPCDSITNNQITFGYHQQLALTGVNGTVAYGNIVASNDPPGQVNAVVTLTLGENDTLIYTDPVSVTLLCGPAAPAGTCGA